MGSILRVISFVSRLTVDSIPSSDCKTKLLRCLVWLCPALLAPVLLMPPVAVADGAKAGLSCAAFDIHAVGFEQASFLLEFPGLLVAAELDDVLFACAAEPVLRGMEEGGTRIGRRWQGVDAEGLFVLRGGHPGTFSPQEAGLEILLRGGPYAVVRAMSTTARQALAEGHLPAEVGDTHAGCGRSHVSPLIGRRSLVRQSLNREQRGMTVFGPGSEAAADAVDGARWLADVSTLASWNRYSLGSEIEQARDWLVDQFNALPGLTVSTKTFPVSGGMAENVIAVLPGTDRPDDWILVGAHYDAISPLPETAAPGAEDNASGCAGVVELARIMTAMEVEATLVFICFSGEEQGLFGSSDHADDLVTQGEDGKVDLMLNMDMIGYSGDADLDLLLETEAPFASLLDTFSDAADAFTSLRTVTSLFAFGSDHVPYLDRDMPALLTIENDWDSYPDYHGTGDLPANIVQEMGTQTLRMNAAVLAHVGGAVVASEPGFFFDGFESGDVSGWSEVMFRSSR